MGTDLSSYDLDDLEGALVEHGMEAVGKQRLAELLAIEGKLKELRERLTGEISLLREQAQISSVATPHLNGAADRLAALLDQPPQEEKKRPARTTQMQDMEQFGDGQPKENR